MKQLPYLLILLVVSAQLGRRDRPASCSRQRPTEGPEGPMIRDEVRSLLHGLRLENLTYINDTVHNVVSPYHERLRDIRL